MQKNWLLILLLLLVVDVCFAQGANQRFFRYNGEVVELGDSKYEVLSRIGEPDGKMRRDRRELRKVDQVSVESVAIQQDHWLYNFGPRRFYYTLIFENNRLNCIKTGEYGYDGYDPENCHTVHLKIERGDIVPVVLMKCGEPDYTETTTIEKYVTLDRFRGQTIRVKLEEWTYNFGDSQPLSILRFEDGTLVEVKQGPRGF